MRRLVIGVSVLLVLIIAAGISYLAFDTYQARAKSSAIEQENARWANSASDMVPRDAVSEILTALARLAKELAA
jgi:LPS O-antigen subunit length determinant protein (WzzB/FepE family)